MRTRFEKPFLRDGDNLWLFFAGHGIRSQNRDYLMPIDGDRGDLERSAIPIHYISERLRRSGADNVILLIDACRSFEGRRDGFGIGQEKQQGVITLFSCSPEESSYEIEELQQGAFTHVLLESLRRQGEGNCATVERLYQQLRYYVPQLVQQYKRVSQTPYGVIEPPTKNHLILLPRSATLADITTLKNDALRAEVQRDFKQAKRYWVRVLAASPADPDAIEGIERLSQGSGVGTPPPAPPPPPVPTAAQAKPRAATPARTEQVVLPAPPKSTFGFEVVTIIRIEKKWLGFGSPKVITQAHSGQTEYRREDLNNGAKLELVLIPGGKFSMGQTRGVQKDLIGSIYNTNSDYLKAKELYEKLCVYEGYGRRVSISPFLMGKYPVTQAQYQAVMGENPSKFTDDSLNRPVEQVNWDYAVAFCQKLSQQTGRKYRLPSEAEWEYACRAGTKTPFHFGSTLAPDLANYASNYAYGAGPKGKYRAQTTEVGSFPANAFGLYNMHGNVDEWCLDHWHESYNGAPNDGSAWTTSGGSSSRVLRGGSWKTYPWACRSAHRQRGGRRGRYDDIGIRVVCASSWAL